MARPVYLSVTLAVVLSGCSRPPTAGEAPAATPTATSLSSAPPAERRDKAGRLPWQARYGMPEALDPATVEFVAPATGEQFRKADRAARKLAGPGWAVRPGPTYRYVSWNLSNPGGYSEEYAATWALSEPAPGVGPIPPNHRIDLSTSLYADPRKASYFVLRASRVEAAGWGVLIDFTTSDGAIGFREVLSLTFAHPTLLPPDPDGLFRTPSFVTSDEMGFRASRSDDQYVYRAAVVSRPRTSQADRYRRDRDVVAPFWESAAAFEAATLAALDRLAADCRTAIAAGRAFEVSARNPKPGHTTLAGTGNVPVRAAVRQSVREQADREIEARRRLVREHAAAMHAAAVATFPDLPQLSRPKATGK